jgi:uncharacterized damage-inducible protein DinB
VNVHTISRWAGAAALAAVLAGASGAVPSAQGGGLDTTIASVKTAHGAVKDYLTKAAAQVPEDKYGYQPTPQVRTMGQLFGHVANASRMICASASGMAAPEAPDAEKLATKAEIQKALADAMAFCDHAFDMISGANGAQTVDLFGMTHSRIGALAFNNAHNFEHYGNLVTYMRINGMVPPSSAGQGGND